MSKIITTKYTNKFTAIKGIFIGLLVFVLFLIFFFAGITAANFSGNHGGDMESMMIVAVISGIMALVMPAIIIFSMVKYGKTYLEITENNIIGQGIEMINGTREGQVAYFNIPYPQLQNMTIKKKWVILYTPHITYKVLANKDKAQKIYNYYIDYIRQ